MGIFLLSKSKACKGNKNIFSVTQRQQKGTKGSEKLKYKEEVKTKLKIHK